MSRLGAIARYELLMAWRRRSLLILGLVVLLTSLAFSVMVASQANRPGTRVWIDPVVQAAADASGWRVEVLMRTTQQISQVALVAIVFNLALVLIVAETIPLDRWFRIRELLDALPVSRAEYLGGKVLSVVSGITLIVLTGGAVSLVMARLVIGEYDLRAVLASWLVLVLPISWANGAASVMAAAFWNNRRTAVLFNLLLLPAFMALLWVALMNLNFITGLFHPLYIRNVTSLVNGESPIVEIVAHLAFGLTYLAGITLLVWTGIWALLRFQEAR